MSNEFTSDFKTNVASLVRTQKNNDGSTSVFFKQYRDAKESVGSIFSGLLGLVAFLACIVLAFFTAGITFLAAIGFLFWKHTAPRTEKEIKVFWKKGIEVSGSRIAYDDIDGFWLNKEIKPRKTFAAAYVSANGTDLYLTGYTEVSVADKVNEVVIDLLGFGK